MLKIEVVEEEELRDIRVEVCVEFVMIIINRFLYICIVRLNEKKKFI